MSFGGIFDIESKEKKLTELEIQSEDPSLWNNHKEMQKINQEKVLLEKSLEEFRNLNSSCEDAHAMLEMIEESKDEGLFQELKNEISKMNKVIESLEVKSFLSGELDGNNAYLSVHSGAGGTEACDWAEMLLRMYTRYCENQEYKVDIMSIHHGDEAGIKSVTLNVQGPFAYGLLKSEMGVHRLVRISPFDANAKRHTSFASVTVYPEVDESIEVVIKPEDIKVDTYRASGAGGQHVNKTDSAIRITHAPSGIIIACQSERSQHANRDRAMKMLKSALYEQELQKRQKEKDELEAQKKSNEWGSQIRSYVLHPYQMVKDHRTNWESGTPQKFLDGEIDPAIEAYLKGMR